MVGIKKSKTRGIIFNQRNELKKAGLGVEKRGEAIRVSKIIIFRGTNSRRRIPKRCVQS